MTLLKKLLAHKFSFPFFLLLTGLLAFGVLIPRLGFYWDDWPVLLVQKQGSLDFLRTFYSYDRPVSFWTYLLTFPLLGAKPLHWHIFLLVLRVANALLFWQVLKLLWPRARLLTGGAALLFLVYPSFSQGTIAVAYSQHFMVYGLFLTSLYAMLRAVSTRQAPAGQAAHPAWPWSLLALVCTALHLFTMEYFAGLELVRPLMLWLYLLNQDRSNHPVAFTKTLRAWWPCLAIVLAFFVWRTWLIQLPYDPNSITWAGLPAFLQATLQNLTVLVADTWAKTFNATLLDFSDRTAILSLALAGLAGVLCFVYLQRLGTQKSDPADSQQAILLGLAAILLGLVPVQLTGRTLLGGLFVDRFSLPAIFGAALLLSALVQHLLRQRLYRNLALAILVGLAAGAHLRSANEYRWDWDQQHDLYWQIYWRAPNLQPGTTLVGPEVFSAYTTGYAASAAINLLYNAPPSSDGAVDYWFMDYFDDMASYDTDLQVGLQLQQSLRNLSFTVDTQKLIFYENSNYGQCMWFLSMADEFNSQVTPDIKPVLSLSQLALASDSPSNLPPQDIFGPEPPQTWCYHYQKMDLARQQGEWDEVLELWQSAQAQDLLPNNQFELFPALEALMRTEAEAEAAQLSADMLLKQPDVEDKLCYAWETWLPEVTPPEALTQSGCTPSPEDTHEP